MYQVKHFCIQPDRVQQTPPVAAFQQFLTDNPGIELVNVSHTIDRGNADILVVYKEMGASAPIPTIDKITGIKDDPALLASLKKGR